MSTVDREPHPTDVDKAFQGTGGNFKPTHHPGEV
jgi:hypothetical protein